MVLFNIDEFSLKLPIRLYHGSKNLYPILKCNGIDFDNSFQKPGYSLFCWTKEFNARGWAIFCVLRELKEKYPDLISINECRNSHMVFVHSSTYNSIDNILKLIPSKEKEYYAYSINIDTDHNYGIGHSSKPQIVLL